MTTPAHPMMPLSAAANVVLDDGSWHVKGTRAHVHGLHCIGCGIHVADPRTMELQVDPSGVVQLRLVMRGVAAGTVALACVLSAACMSSGDILVALLVAAGAFGVLSTAVVGMARGLIIASSERMRVEAPICDACVHVGGGRKALHGLLGLQAAVGTWTAAWAGAWAVLVGAHDVAGLAGFGVAALAYAAVMLGLRAWLAQARPVLAFRARSTGGGHHAIHVPSAWRTGLERALRAW